MLASCDPGPERMGPWEIAQEIYNPDFLSNLAEQFQFSAADKDAQKKLVRIAFQYIYGRRCEDEPERYLKPLKKEYERLLKSVCKFRDHLTHFRADTQDITYEILHAAQILDEPKPETDFPGLTEHDKERGEPYYLELLRLLKILEYGIDWQIDLLSSKGGRPKNNAGLSFTMPRIADFWIEKVGGRFTVDYHKGSGISDAFSFCKCLIEPLDNVPDTQIVTAMREEIRRRTKMRKRTAGLKDLFTETPSDS